MWLLRPPGHSEHGSQLTVIRPGTQGVMVPALRRKFHHDGLGLCTSIGANQTHVRSAGKGRKAGSTVSAQLRQRAFTSVRLPEVQSGGIHNGQRAAVGGMGQRGGARFGSRVRYPYRERRVAAAGTAIAFCARPQRFLPNRAENRPRPRHGASPGVGHRAHVAAGTTTLATTPPFRQPIRSASTLPGSPPRSASIASVVSARSSAANRTNRNRD